MRGGSGCGMFLSSVGIEPVPDRVYVLLKNACLAAFPHLRSSVDIGLLNYLHLQNLSLIPKRSFDFISI